MERSDVDGRGATARRGPPAGEIKGTEETEVTAIEIDEMYCIDRVRAFFEWTIEVSPESATPGGIRIKAPWSVWRLLGTLPLIIVVPVTLLSLWVFVSETLRPANPPDDSSRMAGAMLFMLTAAAYSGWLFLMFLGSRLTRSK